MKKQFNTARGFKLLRKRLRVLRDVWFRCWAWRGLASTTPLGGRKVSHRATLPPRLTDPRRVDAVPSRQPEKVGLREGAQTTTSPGNQPRGRAGLTSLPPSGVISNVTSYRMSPTGLDQSTSLNPVFSCSNPPKQPNFEIPAYFWGTL